MQTNFLISILESQWLPEHLPPKNTSQKIGDHIRSIGHFLGSPQSSFGARAAAAVLSVAIVGYLEPTQNFFFRQRCLWATVIIAIGMNPTSGSSIFNFIMRLIGNTVAMVVAIVNWYIVDGKTPGVLVFLFLFNFIEVSKHSALVSVAVLLTLSQMYGMVKYPRYTVMFMVTIITRQLIVGYSLQVCHFYKPVSPTWQNLKFVSGQEDWHCSCGFWSSLSSYLPSWPLSSCCCSSRILRLLFLDNFSLPNHGPQHPTEESRSWSFPSGQFLHLYAYFCRAVGGWCTG